MTNNLGSLVTCAPKLPTLTSGIHIARYKQRDAMTIELSDMRFFVEAVRYGSITRASLELDIPKSTGSRRMTRMEKELGVQLVKRTTRKVNATPIGKAYFDRCVQVLEEVARAEQMVTDERFTLGGRLRIAIPAELGAHRFAACFAELMHVNSGISMEIEAGPGSRLVDVVASEVDVWIKTGEVPDSNLIVRRLGTLTRSLYASPAYLARHPARKTSRRRLRDAPISMRT